MLTPCGSTTNFPGPDAAIRRPHWETKPWGGSSAVPIASNVVLGPNVGIAHPDLVNLYGCTIGEGTKIATFVEIQKNAFVGARCKVSSHTFICEGVTIEDECFIGHHVCFTNNRFPRATPA